MMSYGIVGFSHQCLRQCWFETKAITSVNGPKLTFQWLDPFKSNVCAADIKIPASTRQIIMKKAYVNAGNSILGYLLLKWINFNSSMDK